MNTPIERHHSNTRMSKIVKHGGVVYLCGQTSGGTPFVELQDQAREVLDRIDALLKEAGTDKGRLLTATIYLKSMSDFAKMNECWEQWLTGSPVPARTTVEVALASESLLIEITVSAAACCAVDGVPGFSGPPSVGGMPPPRRSDATCRRRWRDRGAG